MAEHELGVAENSQIGGEGLVQVARVVGRVDVPLSGWEYRGRDAVASKAAPHTQHEIGFVQDMATGPGEGAAARPERQRMVLGKCALAVERRHDGGLQQLGELAQLIGCIGVKDALPGQDHRTGGVEQHLGRIVNVAFVAGRPAGAHRPVLVRVYRNLNAGHVGGHFHHDRSGPPVFELGESTPHDVADLVRQLHLFNRFGNRGVAAARFEHRKQLRGLARVAERQKQHWSRVRKGGGDAGEGIFRARPVLHRKDARRPPI